jgi:hypothetical protein
MPTLRKGLRCTPMALSLSVTILAGCSAETPTGPGSNLPFIAQQPLATASDGGSPEPAAPEEWEYGGEAAAEAGANVGYGISCSIFPPRCFPTTQEKDAIGEVALASDGGPAFELYGGRGSATIIRPDVDPPLVWEDGGIKVEVLENTRKNSLYILIEKHRVRFFGKAVAEVPHGGGHLKFRVTVRGRRPRYSPACGDGYVTPGETCQTCPADARVAGACGGDGAPEVIAETEQSLTLGSAWSSSAKDHTVALAVPQGWPDLGGQMGQIGVGGAGFDDGHVRIQILDWHRVTHFTLTKNPRGASVYARIERPGRNKGGARLRYRFQLIGRRLPTCDAGQVWDGAACRQPRLTVSKEGAAAVAGTVASDGAQIHCGATCTSPFPAGQPIGLAASTETSSGAVFAGWGGACASFGNLPGGTLLPSADAICTARFDCPQGTSWDPGAQRCAGSCPVDWELVPRELLSMAPDGTGARGLRAEYSDGTVVEGEGPIWFGPHAAGNVPSFYPADRLADASAPPLWRTIWGIGGETLTGYIRGPRTGSVGLYVGCDDYCSIDAGLLSVVEDASQGSASGVISLEAGVWYPITLRYQNRWGSNGFNFFYRCAP